MGGGWVIACDTKGAEPMSQPRPENGVADILKEGQKPEGLTMPEAGDADHEFVSQRLDEFKRAAGDPTCSSRFATPTSSTA